MTTTSLAEIEQLQLQRMPFAKLEQGCWARGIKVGTAIAALTPYLLEIHSRLSKPGYRSDLAPKGLTWTRWCEENRDQLGMAPSTIRALIANLKQPALSSAEVAPNATSPEPVATKPVKSVSDRDVDENNISHPDNDQVQYENEVPERIGKYRITFTIAAAQLRSAQKQAEAAFGGTLLEVIKVPVATSRSARMDEAAAMVEGAKEIVEELKQELEDWKEGLPENLQDGEKAGELESAIDALEEIENSLDVNFDNVDFPGMY